MAMDFDTFEKRLLSDPEFRKEIERYDLKREIPRMIIEARMVKGMTQRELAKRVGTKQPSIARLENGNRLPSLTFLKRIGDALKARLIVTFDFLLPENIKRSSIFANTISKKIRLNSENPIGLSYIKIDSKSSAEEKSYATK